MTPQMPPVALEKILPPPPDEVFAVILTLVTTPLQAALAAGNAIAGSVGQTVSEVRALPRR